MAQLKAALPPLTHALLQNVEPILRQFDIENRIKQLDIEKRIVQPIFLPWYLNPLSFFLTISMTPLMLIACCLYYSFMPQDALKMLFLPLLGAHYTGVIDGIAEALLRNFLLIPLLMLLILPLCEILVPQRVEWFIPQVQEKTGKGRRGRKRNLFHGVLYWSAVLQTITMIISVFFVLPKLQILSFQFLFACMSLAACSMTSAAISHELVHKIESPLDHAVGCFMLSLHLQTHFWLSHVFNHHKWVGTPNDPSTAFKGETLYQFWHRSALGSYKDAWRIDMQRMKQRGTAFFDLRQNRMLRYNLIYVALCLGIWRIGGFVALIGYLTHVILTIFFMEGVNYIEHYGLKRRELPAGQDGRELSAGSTRFEPVREDHSWDAPFRFSSWLAVNIQLHSDHHRAPTKNYNELTVGATSPKMPFSYGAMLLIALLPQLWFQIMDRLLEAYELKRVLADMQAQKQQLELAAAAASASSYSSEDSDA